MDIAAGHGVESTQSPEPSGGTGTRVHRRKANRQACQPCRQAKSRCDGTSEHGEPCSRCARLDYVCQRDTSYRRVSKRAASNKLEDLAEQVRSLQSVIAGNKDTPRQADGIPGAVSLQQALPIEPPFVPASYPATSSSLIPKCDGSGIFSTGSLSGTPYQQQNPFCFQGFPQSPSRRLPGISYSSPSQFRENSNSENFISNGNGRSALTPVSHTFPLPRSLGAVSLLPDQISNLFQLYFDKYHPLFSLLDPTVSPDEFYSRSPLLYWVILATASRQSEDEPTLLSMLSQPLQKMLWSTIGTLPHTPFVVEALILAALWPFPTSSLWTDPSAMLISIAKWSAMTLGLHRPNHIQDFSRVEKQLDAEGIRDAVRIWAGCYIAAQCVMSAGGQESILKPDQAINRACDVGNVFQLPVTLHQHLILTRFAVHAAQMLSENIDTPFGLPKESEGIPIMDQLERDFEGVERSLEGEATNLTRVYINCAKLQLQTYYFFEVEQSEKRRAGLQRCFESASKLIEQVVLTNSEVDLMLHSPHLIFRNVIVASLVLLRILNSSYSDTVDIQAGKRNFNSSLRLLRQSSLQDNDSPGRGSKILNQLWCHYQNSPSVRERPPNIQIQSRLGASLLHDSLWVWRRKCDTQKNSRVGTTLTSPQIPHAQDLTAASSETIGAFPNVTDPSQVNPQQDWNAATTPSHTYDFNDGNMMSDHNEIRDLDMSWFEEMNLVPWLNGGIDPLSLNDLSMSK